MPQLALFIAFLLFASPFSLAQAPQPSHDAAGSPTQFVVKQEIQLEELNGTFTVPVSINDAITLNFIIDSGASHVFIPSDVFRTLVRSGTIVEKDLRELHVTIHIPLLWRASGRA